MNAVDSVTEEVTEASEPETTEVDSVLSIARGAAVVEADGDPDVGQDEADGREEETDSRLTGGRAWSDLIEEPIAGLNPEAAAVEVVNLVIGDTDADLNVEVPPPLPRLAPEGGQFADGRDVGRPRPRLTLEGMPRATGAVAATEGARPAGLAAKRTCDDGGHPQGLQSGDHGATGEAAIQPIAADTDASAPHRLDKPAHDILQAQRRRDDLHRHGVAQADVHDIGCGNAQEPARPPFALRPAHPLADRVRMPIVRLIMQVHGDVPTPFAELLGQLGLQGTVDRQVQLIEVAPRQRCAHVVPDAVVRRHLGQSFASAAQAGALCRSHDEHVQDHLLGHRVALDLLRKQGPQSINSRFSHRLVRQCTIEGGL